MSGQCATGEAEVSRALGICTQGTVARITGVLRAYGLPTSVNLAPHKDGKTGAPVLLDPVLQALTKAPKQPLPASLLPLLTPATLPQRQSPAL